MTDTTEFSASNTVDPMEKKRKIILASMIIGAFITILNETLLNAALPKLSIEFGVSPATIQWLSTGYMLVVAVLIPSSALLVQWFTTRQVFIGAMVIFTLGTLISAIAPGFSILLIGRLFQAAGTGLMMPVLMNTILYLFPVEKRGTAMGSLGLVMMFAPAIGPTLSGIILESFSWRWLFILVIPFAVFSIIFAFIYLINVSEPTKPKVDILSIVLSTIGFGSIIYGFSSSSEGWGNFEVYGMIVIGEISLVFFVIRQLKLEEPLLNLAAFKYPMFTLSTILLIVVMMTMFSTMSLLPFLLQGPFGLTVYITGLIMLPGSILNGILSPISGKLFDLFGPRALIVPGTIILAIVMGFFTQVTIETSITVFIVLHISMMVAISMIMMPAQTSGLNQLPKSYYPHGTAILNTLSQLSGAIGVSLFISLMSAGQKSYLAGSPNPSDAGEVAMGVLVGVQSAFTIGFFFALLAVIVALFIKRKASK